MVSEQTSKGEESCPQIETHQLVIFIFVSDYRLHNGRRTPPTHTRARTHTQHARTHVSVPAFELMDWKTAKRLCDWTCFICTVHDDSSGTHRRRPVNPVDPPDTCCLNYISFKKWSGEKKRKNITAVFFLNSYFFFFFPASSLNAGKLTPVQRCAPPSYAFISIFIDGDKKIQQKKKRRFTGSNGARHLDLENVKY